MELEIKVPADSRGSDGISNSGNSEAAGGMVPTVQISRRGRKARKSCASCQRSHRMCDDERPCGMCIRRGIGHACYDGIRKKPKYLEEVPGATVMDISPSIHGNNFPQMIQHKEQPQQPRWFVTPGEYSKLESTVPGNTTSEQNPYWGLQEMCIQSSRDSVGRGKDNDPDKSDDQQILIPDTYFPDDLVRCDLLSQQNAKLDSTPQMAECDMHVESTSNTSSQLSFAIESGWSSTFF